MSKPIIVEVAQFKLKSGVSEGNFLEASQVAQDGFISKCVGYISRELFKKEDNTWLDMVRWTSMEDAQSAMNKFMNEPGAKKFEEMIDPSTVQIMHLTQVKVF
jgi:hypothetical protein